MKSAQAGPFEAALAAEHAATWAYGVIGAKLTAPAAATAARSAEAAHRARRDALVLQLFAAGATPAPAAAEYELPYPITDQASALKLAIDIEDRTGAIWRAALGESAAAERQAALDALVDCAVRATGWRSLAGVTPATVTFPGKPS